MGAEEPPEKKLKAEDGAAAAKPKEEKEKKDKKEKKEKKEGKEGKDKKDKKEKKEKKDKENADGNKAGGPAKEKKEKKDKKDKKDKKEKKDKLAKPTFGRSIALKGAPGKAVAKKLAVKKKAVAATSQPKALVKTEDDYEPVNRWWDKEGGAESGKKGAKKWDSFEHHGVMFAPDYEVHGVPMKYDGKEVKLSEAAEELATYWCSVKGTPYETKEVFINNFWSEFTKVLPPDTPIKEFSKCDFDPIVKHRESEREKRLNRTKEEKEKISAESNAKKAYFGHALLNGVRERLGAVGLEPPQLFRGRGEHPKQGLFKRRTIPGSVTLNIAPDAPVPKVRDMPGHAWCDIVHENTVQWIASFEDGLLKETKYVGFAATSGVKGQPDLLKYDRARRLLRVVDKVRASYEKLQDSKSETDRQKAVATYFIDKLALRVGGEKDTEEEADTVGCCSLRVEHLRLEEPNTIVFDFLGKDSIRYYNEVQVTEKVFKNVKGFMAGKEPEQEVFDKVVPGTVNEYFKEFMEDLTAKVFRTFNASFTLQQELSKFDVSKKNTYTQDQLVKFYNDANREVAILCNHQKAESKTHGEAMNKMQTVKDTMEKNLKLLKKHLQALEQKKEIKENAKMPKDVNGTKKKIAETKLRLEKHNHAMAVKEENKTVSLGTSKTNYMDPRITVSWCKKVDLAIERVFPRTTRTKFPWAMHFKSTYQFD